MQYQHRTQLESRSTSNDISGGKEFPGNSTEATNTLVKLLVIPLFQRMNLQSNSI